MFLFEEEEEESDDFSQTELTTSTTPTDESSCVSLTNTQRSHKLLQLPQYRKLQSQPHDTQDCLYKETSQVGSNQDETLPASQDQQNDKRVETMTMKNFFQAWPPICLVVAIPFLIIGGFVFLIFIAVFFAGPFVYFTGNPFVYFTGNPAIFGLNEINEKYRREGIQLSGQVVKRWTVKRDKASNSYYIRVLYRTPEVENYVRDFDVLQALQSQEHVDLVILPEYPRSARIKHESMDHIYEYKFEEYAPWLVVFGSFAWICIWNVTVSYLFTVNKLEDNLDFVAKYLVTCEVVLAWIAAYFLARAQRNASLRDMLFGAKPCRSSSGGVSQDQMKTPSITYHKMFPSSNKSFLDVICIIITDCARLLVGFLVGFPVGVYILLFGGGYCLMYPLIVNRKIKHLLLEDYLTRGKELEGTVVHHSRTQVEIEYVVSDETSRTAQRYRKILPVRRYKKGCCSIESKAVPDNPRIIVLPNIPTSARLVDEIELCDKIYKADWARFIMAVIIFGSQMVYATYVLGDTWGYLFPNIPTWGIAVIYIALQLCLGFLGGIIRQRIFIHRILYNATHVSEDEGTELEDENTI